MKKFLALILVAIMMFTIVACNDKEDQGNINLPSTPSEQDPYNKPADKKDPTKDFEKVDETVYVNTDSLNVRKTPSVEGDDNIFKSYPKDFALNRVGYNETWSKLLIDGVEYYAKSEFLTTNKPLVFENTNDVLKIIVDPILDENGEEKPGQFSLRTEPVWKEDGSNVGEVVTSGTILSRIAVATEADSEGILWSKVIYNEKTYYVSTNPKYVKVISPEGYDIALPEGFVLAEGTDNTWIDEETNSCVVATVEYIGTEITLKEFADYTAAILTEMLSIEEPLVVAEQDGVMFVEYLVTAEDSSAYTLVCFNADENGYVYATTFACDGADFETLAPIFFTYAQSITIGTPAAE